MGLGLMGFGVELLSVGFSLEGVRFLLGLSCFSIIGLSLVWVEDRVWW